MKRLTMRITRRGAQTCAAAASLLVLAGCGASTSSAGAADADAATFSAASMTPAGVTVVFQGSGAEVLSNGQVILPLDGYDALMANANDELIGHAATAIERACMSAKGLPLPASLEGLPLPAEPPSTVFYGVASEADAEQLGYRVPDESSDASPAPAPTVPANVSEAFSGSGGCEMKAFDQLEISRVQQGFTTIQGLRAEALEEASADKRLIAANAHWSACMKTAGYDYATPQDPPSDRSLLGRGLAIPKGDTLAPPSPAEKAVAEKDMACKESVDYIPTFATVVASYQRTLIQSNNVELRQTLAMWADALSIARSAA